MKRIILASVVVAPLLAAGAADLDAQTRFYVYEPRECGRLGVSFTGEEPVTIRGIRPGSPADEAGLQPGDVLVRIDGAKASLPSILDFAYDLEPGDTVRLHFRRGGADRQAVLVAAADICIRRVVRTAAHTGGDPSALRFQLRDSTIILRFDSMRSEWAELFADLARREQANRDRLRNDWAEIQARLGQQQRISRDTMLQQWLREQRTMRDSLLESLRERRMVVPQLRVFAPGRVPPAMVQPLTVGWHAVAGAEFSALNADLAEYFQGATEGLLVLRVAPRTPSAHAGLRPGDIVIRAGNDPVRTIADLRFVVAAAERRPLSLVVIRKGTRKTLALPPER